MPRVVSTSPASTDDRGGGVGLTAWTAAALIGGGAIIGRLYQRHLARSAPYVHGVHDQSMAGRTVIVTGANTGLGKETVKQLHKMGSNVILACRDAKKGQAVAEQLARQKSSGSITVLELDLANFDSICRFVTDVEALNEPVHVLVNNAAVMAKTFERVGFLEKSFVTNHLGPFALTLRLLPLLAQSGSLAQPARIVNVSSRLEKKGSLAFFSSEAHEDEVTHEYKPFKAYGTSKLANIMFSNELERRYMYLVFPRPTPQPINLKEPRIPNLGI